MMELPHLQCFSEQTAPSLYTSTLLISAGRYCLKSVSSGFSIKALYPAAFLFHDMFMAFTSDTVQVDLLETVTSKLRHKVIINKVKKEGNKLKQTILLILLLSLYRNRNG